MLEIQKHENQIMIRFDQIRNWFFFIPGQVESLFNRKTETKRISWFTHKIKYLHNVCIKSI
jgi:hypothetical protein